MSASSRSNVELLILQLCQINLVENGQIKNQRTKLTRSQKCRQGGSNTYACVYEEVVVIGSMYSTCKACVESKPNNQGKKKQVNTIYFKIVPFLTIMEERRNGVAKPSRSHLWEVKVSVHN